MDFEGLLIREVHLENPQELEAFKKAETRLFSDYVLVDTEWQQHHGSLA